MTPNKIFREPFSSPVIFLYQGINIKISMIYHAENIQKTLHINKNHARTIYVLLRLIQARNSYYLLLPSVTSSKFIRVEFPGQAIHVCTFCH